MSENSSKLEAQINELLNFTYKHIQIFPAKQIEEAVILVSINRESNTALQKITGLQSNASNLKLVKLDNKITVLNPTESFLNGNSSYNFVSMHYILKTVKRAKFMLVFSNADAIDVGLKTIKETIIRFMSLFKEQQRAAISRSCGIVITDASREISKYLSVLKSLYTQQQFIKDQNVTKFAEVLCNNEVTLLFKSTKDSTDTLKEAFIQLVNKLSFFQLKDKFNTKLLSSYKSYVSKNLSKKWEQFFKLLFFKLDKLIIENIQDQNINNNQLGYHQSLTQCELQLLQQAKMFNIANIQEKKRNFATEISQSESLRLLIFIQNELIIVKQIEGADHSSQESNMKVIKRLMDALYTLKYLTCPQIQYVLMSYFQIHRFLSDFSDDTQTDLFQAVNFNQSIRNLQYFNERLRVETTTVLDLLENQLKTSQKGYPFQKIVNTITIIVNGLRNNNYAFCTSRLIKKFLKIRAQFTYKYATILSQQYGVEKEVYLGRWIQFLEQAQQSILIDSAKIEKALNIIAEELIQRQEYALALKLYKILPEYKSYKKIIDIYERGLKLCPEILKYILLDDLKDLKTKISYIKDYCQFLLTIGFNERVREICLEGLRVVDCQNRKECQDLKSLLLHARSGNSRELHNKFLEHSILEDKIITIDQYLLKELKAELLQA